MTYNYDENPDPVYEAGDLVWHYTNAAALQNILTKHELWASDTAFMNDSLEGHLGSKFLKEAKEAMGQDFPKNLNSYVDEVGNWNGTAYTDYRDGRFLLSGSSAGDSLTNWRGYAGTGELSYSIALDNRDCLSVLAPEVSGKSGTPNYNASIEGWFPVKYNREYAKDEATKAIKEIIEEFSSGSENAPGEVISKIGETTERLRNTVKHHGFIHEEELRTIVKASHELFRFRAGPWGMVPYVALTGSGDSNNNVAVAPSRLPIREIRISPGSHRKNAVESLNMLLDNTGYGGRHAYSVGERWGVKVSLSEVPFR